MSGTGWLRVPARLSLIRLRRKGRTKLVWSDEVVRRPSVVPRAG